VPAKFCSTRIAVGGVYIFVSEIFAQFAQSLHKRYEFRNRELITTVTAYRSSPLYEIRMTFAIRCTFLVFFSAFHAVTEFVDRPWRYVRSRFIRLHRIRAETLFALSACLRRQIFIPYAPISRSVGQGCKPATKTAAATGVKKRMGDCRQDRRGKSTLRWVGTKRSTTQTLARKVREILDSGAADIVGRPRKRLQLTSL